MATYKIKSGDTLSQIAKSKGFTLNQLKKANPQITDLNKIRAGQTIKMPYTGRDMSKNLGPSIGTKKSPYRGMTKKQMADIQMNKPKKKVVKKTVSTPTAKPTRRPEGKIARLKRIEAYKTKSPSMGRRNRRRS